MVPTLFTDPSTTYNFCFCPSSDCVTSGTSNFSRVNFSKYDKKYLTVYIKYKNTYIKINNLIK